MYYEKLHTPVGVKIEHISGGEQYSPRVQHMLAAQIWSENGKNGYRVLDHTTTGAPVTDTEQRISLTHTQNLMAVATLPATPDIENLEQFNLRTALGVDAENRNREQCLRLRTKYLDAEEQQMTDPDNVEQNILAWTVKEAVYKAMLTPGLPLAGNIKIKRLPVIQPEPMQQTVKTEDLGSAIVNIPGKTEPVEFILYTYSCNQIIVTVAITPATATYKKQIV